MTIEENRKELLNLLRSFNCEIKDDKARLNSLIPALSGLKIVQYKIPKGMSIYRARPHKTRNEVFSFEDQISYRRDYFNIDILGRCNIQQSSKFYGAVTSTEIKHGWMPAIVETSKLYRDGKDGYELYSIGKWKAKEDLYLYAIKPPKHKSNASDLSKELYGLYEDKKPEPIENEIFEQLGKEFSKNVPSDQNEQYYLSACLSEAILNGSQIGILYPSVQVESKSYNIVMNPDKFDRYFEIDKVMVSELFKVKKEVLVRNSDICLNAKSQPFQFYRVEEREYQPDDAVKNRLFKNGISKGDIDWVFNERKKFLAK